MKTKTLIILLVVLAILAGLGIWLFQSSNTPKGSDVMGSLLMTDFPANEVSSIVIERPSDTVTLAREDGVWVVKDRFGYNADFSKITELIRKVKQTKVGRKFPSNQGVLNRLSLNGPGEKSLAEEDRGTRITMRGKENKEVLNIILGNTRKKGERGIPDSQYVMPAAGPDIYLVDQIFSAYSIPAPKWLEKSPVKVPAEDIQKMVCRGPDKTLRYDFERPRKGKDFVLKSPETTQPMKKTQVNRLARALSGLQIEDVADPEAPPPAVSKDACPEILFTRFDGLTYAVYPGKGCSPTEPCYLKIAVSFEPGPEPEKADDKASKEKAEALKKERKALADEARKLNEELKPWVFVIPKWQHDAFTTQLNELLEKETEKKTES